MIIGTISYRQSDLEAADLVLSEQPKLALWRSALLACVVGAVLGASLVVLTTVSLSDSALEGLAAPLWGALVGSMGMVTFGAWRLVKSDAGRNAVIEKLQSFTADDAAIVLRSDAAETLMRWRYFTKTSVGDDLIALRTIDQTVLVLRPEFFSSSDDWKSLQKLVQARTMPVNHQ